jgi:hypothetical protein
VTKNSYSLSMVAVCFGGDRENDILEVCESVCDGASSVQVVLEEDILGEVGRRSDRRLINRDRSITVGQCKRW